MNPTHKAAIKFNTTDELIAALNELLSPDHVQYVEDKRGLALGRVTLVERTSSDGSISQEIVIS